MCIEYVSFFPTARLCTNLRGYPYVFIGPIGRSCSDKGFNGVNRSKLNLKYIGLKCKKYLTVL